MTETKRDTIDIEKQSQSKKKIAYEPPIAIELGELGKGVGASCNPFGTSATEGCITGLSPI